MRKLFFGSTTERVLRETTRPVLVVPPVDPGPLGLEDAKRLIRRILVPVDLSAASLQQIHAGRQLAEILKVPLILAHVIEPVKIRPAARVHVPTLEADRRAVAEDRLAEFIATIPPELNAEALVAYGDPSEELAKIARDRQAGLMVIGLHSSPLLGPRMGSVTYRVLCLSPTLTLALPPAPSAVAGSQP
jgi:nucleotide-binding universal stress UspA family protein